MSSNLTKLLTAVIVAIVLGFAVYPIGGLVADLFRWRDNTIAQAQRAAEEARQLRRQRFEEALRNSLRNSERNTHSVVIEDDSAGDDWDTGFSGDDSGAIADTSDDDYTGDDGGFVERDNEGFMVGDVEPSLADITEEEGAPERPEQQKIPAPLDSKRKTANLSGAKKIITLLERDAKQAKRLPYINEEFAPASWKKPADIYKTVSERVLTKLGSTPTNASIFQFLEKPENRLDLARLTLMRKAGVDKLAELSEQRMGNSMLAHVTSDLDWMTDMLYSGPTDRLGLSLKYLATIYARFSEEMGDPAVRRIATTTALEFGREGWSEKDMLARFNYYYTSYKEGKLNKIFDTLKYWETRIVTGNRSSSSWGSPQSLAWQRDNVCLPVEGYLGASGQLVYRLRNTAGDSVFSGEYLAPVMKAFNNITALAHREIGGVCGACSHYGAYGALAAGIPAMTMGEPGHCAYTVRIGNQWRKGYSIYWQHSMHKTFWGLHDWEFLILTQELYSDFQRTRTSDMLCAMAEFLASQRMTFSAINCYDASTQAQPLNWPAWTSYAGYLKQKAPKDKARWKELCERVTDTLAEKYHNVAATLQARYIYPELLPLMPNLRERNKLFAAFFRKCASYGVHTWDVQPLLNAQMAGCTTDKEKLNYMKEALSALMDKPDYSGAVLAWGLDIIFKNSDEDDPNAAKMQDEFTKLIMNSMRRMRTGKKDLDATWSGLGEAINTAATNDDTKTFQAIGKLAMSKCRHYFPKHKFRFRPFTGKVVSANGLITTATTLDGNGVKQSCLHWGVLQKTGGSIPIKFEGKNGIKLKLEGTSNLNGVVALFDCAIKNDRPFYLEASDDGQNWSAVPGKPEISGSVMRFDLRKSQASGRFIRLLREGDKWDSGHIVGFYVYGKLQKG